MKVTQALIAIGGKASRLRADGIDVPISKSFLLAAGKPLLYWSLSGLHGAGVQRVVLCGNDDVQLREAEHVLGDLPFKFDSVTFFRDAGLGVHGLPYHVQHLMDDAFFFECGHSIVQPSHYIRLADMKDVQNVVFSAFEAHPANPRQPVTVSGDHVLGLASNGVSSLAVAHPFVVSKAYAKSLPQLDFNIAQVIEHYAGRGQLQYVLSKMPPEFDVVQEMDAAHELYEAYLPTLKVEA
jgi:hypothetical protein